MTNLNDASRAARRSRQRESAARNEVVPNFPEITSRETQCRLCGLADSAPDVLTEIHRLYKDGLGGRALETRCLELWMKMNETPPHHRSYERHFERHVNFSEVSMAVSEALDLPSGDDLGVPTASSSVALVKPKVPAAPTPAAAAPTAARRKPRPEDTEAGAGDYFDMENVIHRLKERVDEIDEGTAFIDKDNRVNTYGIVVWIKLISELRQALEALNRMKNGDRLMKSIVQAHTKRHSQLVSAPLIQRFQVVLSLLRSGSATGAVAELEKLAGGDIREIMLQAAEEAIRESCEVYKLQ